MACRQLIAAAQALDAGQPQTASRQLSAVLRAHPTHPEVLRLHAGILDLHGRSREAVQVMRQALSQRPDDALYHNTMATILGNAGEFDAAIGALRRTCELQPDMAIAWYNLGVMLTRCVRNDEAVTALRRAVTLAPEHAAAQALLADMLRTGNRVDEAAAEYRRILAARPWTGMAWWGLGRRYLERTAHWRRQRAVFTDKLPNNWIYIGAIRAMLPAARIVCCRRDPLEICLSCYRQHLNSNEYTRTLDDLAI